MTVAGAEATRRVAPTPGRFYLDTSSYLAVLLGERGHEALVRETAGGVLLSSSRLALEAHRTLVHLARHGILRTADLNKSLERLDADLDQFVLRDLTLDLCRRGAVPVVSTPRSLDLAHLRTALWFHAREPLTRFVSLDGPQNDAAREVGLPV